MVQSRPTDAPSPDHPLCRCIHPCPLSRPPRAARCSGAEEAGVDEQDLPADGVWRPRRQDPLLVLKTRSEDEAACARASRPRRHIAIRRPAAVTSPPLTHTPTQPHIHTHARARARDTHTIDNMDWTWTWCRRIWMLVRYAVMLNQSRPVKMLYVAASTQ